MFSAVCVRANALFFGVALALCFLANSNAAYAQEPENPQPIGAQVAIQLGEAVGDVVVGEALAVADFAIGIDGGDPQGSKLHSKVAVDNALIRRICKLDEEQRKQLDALDEKWVKGKAAAGKQAGNIAAGLVRVFAGGMANVQRDNPTEAAARVTKAYKAKLAEILKPDQLAEYEKQKRERDAFRCKANAECILALLDDRLSIKDDQREELIKSLTEWSDIDKIQVVFYFSNPTYVPNLPASALKALNPKQRKILDGMQKADFQFEMFDDGQEAIFITQ